jgi:RNA-directed DNA polymerase
MHILLQKIQGKLKKGFLTFICGRSRRGNFLLQRKSRGDRMQAKLQAVKEELRRRIQDPNTAAVK